MLKIKYKFMEHNFWVLYLMPEPSNAYLSDSVKEEIKEALSSAGMLDNRWGIRINNFWCYSFGIGRMNVLRKLKKAQFDIDCLRRIPKLSTEFIIEEL